MKIKLFEQGGAKLYIFADEAKAKDAALKLCGKLSCSFYPGAQEIGRNIVTECCNGYLLKKERLSGNAVCTINQAVYQSLDIPETEYELTEDLMLPVSRVPKERKSNIKNFRLVFIAGRGIGNKSNYDRLKKLAEICGAGLGCSRPIAMNGWESYDNCVGISGNILNADMIICFGVSGAIPFIKGIENCKTVIAVNKDRNALIFKNADYAVVDDCMNLISYLEQNYK